MNSPANTPALVCNRETRRRRVRQEARLNGLDYLEVEDQGTALRVYLLGKLPPAWLELDGEALRRRFRIDGGRRIRDVAVIGVVPNQGAGQDEDDWLDLYLNQSGDFSGHTLRVVEVDAAGRQTGRPHPGFDLRYAALDFRFGTECAGDLDCRQAPGCPPKPRSGPLIDYLARDYASFRQLLFDRMALLLPDWRERHVPDLGVTLIEILAYVGDQLSYYQDAVATEAYLDTARRRESVRRHVRLVDYFLHEGCNARAWVCLHVSQDIGLKPAGFHLMTRPAGFSVSGTMLKQEQLPNLLPRPWLVFEPLVENPDQEIRFRAAHNEIRFYTWGDQRCCLPAGATAATLADPGGLAPPPPEDEPATGCRHDKDHDQESPRQTGAEASNNGHRLELRKGDILLFEEARGPNTGLPADADPGKRHAVRLTRAEAAIDPLTRQRIVEIEWCREDALPFALCLSSLSQNCLELADVSIARGNVILADHGERVREALGSVPAVPVSPDCAAECCAGPGRRPARFRPVLARPELTSAENFPPPAACHNTGGMPPAAALLQQDPRSALPAIRLYGFPALANGEPVFGPEDLADLRPLVARLADPASAHGRFLRSRLSPETWKLLKPYASDQALPAGLEQVLRQQLLSLRQTWTPRPDLLASRAGDLHFVVEAGEDRRVRLRFGDGDLGRMPEAGSAFQAEYRIGNGPAGNVGADSLTHIVFRTGFPDGVLIQPRNPLPTRGGTAPESLQEARLFAPDAFRKDLQRAITAEDYAALVERDFRDRVQRAAAALRWTGSGWEVLVAVDPFENVDSNGGLLEAIECRLRRYRRIGHEVRVDWASPVPLRIELGICVQNGYLRGQVKAELLRVLGHRRLPDGRLGFFHPDRLSFGEGIHLSRLVAVAQAVEGVESVRVERLERLHEGPNGEIGNGLLPLGPLEIARLDNDPGFPENGVLTLHLGGGR